MFIFRARANNLVAQRYGQSHHRLQAITGPMIAQGSQASKLVSSESNLTELDPWGGYRS